MNFPDLRVIFKRLIMLLHRPSHTRYAAALALAWCVFGACLALDFCGQWTLANSPAIGAELRSDGRSVAVTSLEPSGALQRAGVREGERVLSIAGRPVDAAAFHSDPDTSPTWRDRDLFWEWQRSLESATRGGSLTMVLGNGSATHTVTLHVHRLGWRKALERGWALRLVGWIFVLLALLIWVKKQSEASLVNTVAYIGIFLVFSTMSGYINRDLCVSASALTILTFFNYLGTQATILTLHMGMVFPTPYAWLKRHPWVRFMPWCAYLVILVLHLERAFPSPAPTVYVFSSISLLGLLLIFVLRLLRTRDPLEKAQLQWVTLGSLIGFLPWLALSALPEAVHLTPVPERFTLLFSVSLPLCFTFAILRYRLLDVDRIFDWVIAHTVALGGFLLLELASWNWLSIHFAPETATKPLLLALSFSVLMFLYAPLRSWSLRGIRKLTGTERPPLAESLHKLLERAQVTEDPTAALEQTLRWAFNPDSISWIFPGREYDAQLDRLQLEHDGLLGYELGEACPPHLEASAWIPVQIGPATAALILSPHGSSGWNRHDLRMARALVRAGEPLFEMRNMLHSHLQTQAAMREQREELVREMHDGLGSQLFGASLLSNVSDKLTEPELRERFAHVSAALGDAMDSLRTGLTVLGAPPGAFSPAVLALLMRAERVLGATGIVLQTQIDDEAAGLQLHSRTVFSILRAMQEALTNIARHSKASSATVQLTLRDRSLNILIRDNGVGFVSSQPRHGNGLPNIARRLQMLGGNAQISAAPRAGCTIELSLPV